MRVMLVSGPAAGGIRVHLWQLLSGLPAHGAEALLAAPLTLAAPPGTQRADVAIGERLHPLRDLAQVRALTLLRAEWKADVVHAHGYKAALVASVAGTKPLVVTFHNLWPPGAGALARAGLRWAVRESACQVGVSEAVLASVSAATGPLPHPVVIPNAVDASLFAELPVREDARQRLGLPQAASVVGFAGRLLPAKGAQVLLAAAAELVREQTELLVAVAGEGPQRAELEAVAAEPPLAGHVRFLGHLEEVRLLFAAADVWAIPSLQEGGGIVALEAMAAGLPLVASRVGGLAETLEDGATAFLVPPDDPSALAAALRQLLADSDRARALGGAASSAARALPAPAEVVTRIVATYREVMERVA